MIVSFEQLQQVYERDMRRLGQKVHDVSQLPLSYEDLTTDWLTQALCPPSLPRARVECFMLEAADDGTSNRRGISVDYNDAGREAGLPSQLFCKSTHGLTNRFTLGVSGAALTEVQFYQRVRPLLRGVDAPECVFARYDADTFNSMVILLDLRPHISAFCDHQTAISKARAQSQVGLLARVHGQGYGRNEIIEQLPHFFSWPQYFTNTCRLGIRKGSEQGFARAVDLIPPRLYRRASEVWPATVKAVDLNERLPTTLAHGDVHLKNWYVTDQGDMALSDWQCVTRAYWARDFGYAMATSLTIENRRAWERDLLREYLDRLHAEGGPKISFDEGWVHYRQHLASALTWWTITYNPAPGMPDMQPLGASIEFVSRLATAMDDLETLDALG